MSITISARSDVYDAITGWTVTCGCTLRGEAVGTVHAQHADAVAELLAFTSGAAGLPGCSDAYCRAVGASVSAVLDPEVTGPELRLTNTRALALLAAAGVSHHGDCSGRVSAAALLAGARQVIGWDDYAQTLVQIAAFAEKRGVDVQWA